MNEKNFSSEHRSVRSRSEMRVDLHIYIIPQELWREHLQSAVNQVINETVSAGFIRVFPDATVSSLREEIENQIGFEIIPREFVFLKCVGRCFTRIKSRQENLLKVKNFIPPQAYAPEMFILEATPDIRALPDSGSVSAQSQTSFQNGYHSDSGSFSSHSRVPPIKSNTVAVQTDRGSRVFSNSENVEDDCGERQQRSSLAESLNERFHNSKSTQTHSTSHESPEIKKRNPMKSKNRFPRSSSPEDEGYDPPWNATPNQSPKLSSKTQQHQAKSIQTLSEKEMRGLEDQLRSQIETEKRKTEETEKAEKERVKRKKEEEQRRKQEEQKRMEEENWRKKKQEDEEKKRKMEELRKEEERRIEEEMEKEEEKRKDEQKKREQEEQRKREEEEEEEMRQEERRRLEEEKQGQKKRQQAAEKATVLREIEELKVARQDLEERQDFLTKKTKLLQTKTPVNKHNVRDNWKKKYFEEKKKTAPLDEHGNRLKQHLETLHKKLMANLESLPPPPPPASGARTEATMKKANGSSSSLHVKAKRLEHEIEDVQQQLESVKMKLTGEIKLRNQAEKDIRVLRAELSQRKLQNHLQHDRTPRTQYVAMPKS